MQISATYTDLYELTMSQVYFHKDNNHTSVFDYYFRTHPFKGGYTIFAGLENVLSYLQNFKFTPEDIDYLHKNGFDADFLEYLKQFKFTGTINAMKEGEIIFPDSPVLQVEAPIIEAQIIETLLLNILNYQSLIATKSRRIRHMAGDRTLLDMGLRRAHATGGYFASRAVMIGGFDATSNVIAGRDFNIPISGTMAHSFIQSYQDELAAFRDFAKIRPNQCVFLVDTYNTLKSGVPNAITVAKEMEERGEQLLGIRLDSGDLAYLSKKARKMLDDAGLEYVKIVVSNQLDEWVIRSLNEQKSPIDVFGVGTSLVTGKPDASLDGVYKLAAYKNEPSMKISDNIIKVSIPSKKQVYRLFDDKGKFYGADAIALYEEEKPSMMFHPFDPRKQLSLVDFKSEKLLTKVMENNEILLPASSVQEIADYSQHRLDLLPTEYKRLDNPHIYKIGLSPALKEIRDKIIFEHS